MKPILFYEHLWKREEAEKEKIFLAQQHNKRFLAKQKKKDIEELKENDIDLEDLNGVIDFNNRCIVTKDVENSQNGRAITTICKRGTNDI